MRALIFICLATLTTSCFASHREKELEEQLSTLRQDVKELQVQMDDFVKFRHTVNKRLAKQKEK